MRALTAALVLASALPAAAASSPAVVEDDYPRALAEARARGMPLLVDVWAPW